MLFSLLTFSSIESADADVIVCKGAGCVLLAMTPVDEVMSLFVGLPFFPGVVGAVGSTAGAEGVVLEALLLSPFANETLELTTDKRLVVPLLIIEPLMTYSHCLTART
jgi:hypothetical protein